MFLFLESWTLGPELRNLWGPNVFCCQSAVWVQDSGSCIGKPGPEGLDIPTEMGEDGPLAVQSCGMEHVS